MKKSKEETKITEICRAARQNRKIEVPVEITKNLRLAMAKKRLISRLYPNRVGLRKVLGELEADVMEVLWRQEQATVREVHQCLCADREIAYTTVMTVMVRLSDKRLLAREKDGNAFIYSPVLSKKEFTRLAVGEIVDGLLDEFAEPMMVHLIERISKEDIARVEQLAKLVEERKREDKLDGSNSS